MIDIKLRWIHSGSLPVNPAHHGRQSRDLFSLIGLVAAPDRVFDTMGDVVLQDFYLDAPKRGANRGDLGDDIDVAVVLINHARQAAHLALDSDGLVASLTFGGSWAQGCGFVIILMLRYTLEHAATGRDVARHDAISVGNPSPGTAIRTQGWFSVA